MHGKGVYTNLMHYESLDAVGTNGFLWKKYEGDFENDKMTGQGTIFWADDSVFSGKSQEPAARRRVYRRRPKIRRDFLNNYASISGHKPQPKTKKPCADIPKQAVGFDEEKSPAEGVGRHVLPLEAAAEQRSTQCANDCDGADSAAAKWCRECEKAICSTCARACSTNLHHVLVDICNSTAVIPSNLPQNVEEDKDGEMVGRGRGDPDDGSDPWLEGNEELLSGEMQATGGMIPCLTLGLRSRTRKVEKRRWKNMSTPTRQEAEEAGTQRFGKRRGRAERKRRLNGSV